jgi:YidC/Oxa1 family membrane protein insertase
MLLPLGMKQAQSQRAMIRLKPQIDELQRRYAGDRAKIGQEQMRLYRESGVNPVGGCLPMMLQMPIWFALYSALINVASNNPAFQSSTLWSTHFEDAISAFQAPFLWIPNLAHAATPIPDDPRTWPVVLLPLLTAATQWVVQRMSTMPAADPQQQQMNRMMEFMPLMFLMFSFQVASGLVLYWVVSNIYSIGQQYFTVGWGSLPFLGSPPPAVVKSADTSADAAARRTGRPRRKSSGSSTRRRRGK